MTGSDQLRAAINGWLRQMGLRCRAPYIRAPEQRGRISRNYLSFVKGGLTDRAAPAFAPEPSVRAAPPRRPPVQAAPRLLFRPPPCTPAFGGPDCSPGRS